MKNLSFLLLFSMLACSPSQKKVLMIFAHPDDEAMVRGFIARLVEKGNQVSAIYLTVGEGGKDHRWTDRRPMNALTAEEREARRKSLGVTRRLEMADAAKAYHFRRYEQLFFPDDPLRDPVTDTPAQDPAIFLNSKGPWKAEQIKSSVEAIAESLEPDLVISFYPHQAKTHAHHQATASLVEEMYRDHRLGNKVQNLFGFYEYELVNASKQADSKIQFHSPRIVLLPHAKSEVKGSDYGKTYAEIGTRGAVEHESQMNGETEKFLKDWKNNPEEILSPVDSARGMTSLLDALGKVNGIERVEDLDGKNPWMGWIQQISAFFVK